MYEEPYWIEGLTTSETLDRLEEWGLSCKEQGQRGETMSAWECEGSADEPGVGYRASVVGRGQNVRLVEARVEGEAGTPPEETAARFLALVASLPYGEVDRPRAQQWVRENTGAGGKQKFGSTNLELFKEDHAITLRIVSTRH